MTFRPAKSEGFCFAAAFGLGFRVCFGGCFGVDFFLISESHPFTCPFFHAHLRSELVQEVAGRRDLGERLQTPRDGGEVTWGQVDDPGERRRDVRTPAFRVATAELDQRASEHQQRHACSGRRNPNAGS